MAALRMPVLDFYKLIKSKEEGLKRQAAGR